MIAAAEEKRKSGMQEKQAAIQAAKAERHIMEKPTVLLCFLLLSTSSFSQEINLLSCIDTSISGVNIDDRASSERILGKNISLNDKKLPITYSIRNKTGNEVGTFISFPGGSLNEFSAFQVRHSNIFDSSLGRNSLISKFQTSRNISLGASFDLVNKLLCPSYSTTNRKKDSTFIIYRVFDKGHNFWHFNMPSYSAKYIFVKNRLVEFTFGFDEP
jgi:hypothetical protein